MDWWYWRPVVAGFGRLTEIRERWTIDDLADAHEVLDVQEDAQRRAQASKDDNWRPR